MLHLRAATNADLNDIAKHVLDIQVGEFSVPITREEQPDLLDLESVFTQGNGTFLLALHDEQIVGTAGLLDAGQGLAVLRKMFVAPDYRGRKWGTAKLLLDALIDHARKNNFQKIQLGTQARLSAACRFYEKNGFTALLTHMLEKNFPLMTVDDRFYSMDL